MSGHNPADHWIGVWVLAIICMVGNSCMSGSCGNRDYDDVCYERAITTCLQVGPPEPEP